MIEFLNQSGKIHFDLPITVLFNNIPLPFTQPEIFFSAFINTDNIVIKFREKCGIYYDKSPISISHKIYLYLNGETFIFC